MVYIITFKIERYEIDNNFSYEKKNEKLLPLIRKNENCSRVASIH